MSGRPILIEGLPGAGKSSTAEHIGDNYLRQGISCEWFLEEDEEHPLDFSGMALP
jgi:thymidylate kinase